MNQTLLLSETEGDSPLDGVRGSVRDLPASTIREIAHLGMGQPGVIPLYFGEPEAPTPDFVRNAAAAALAEGDTYYKPNSGIPELRAALASYLTGLYGTSFSPKNITVTVSGSDALMIAFQCLIEPGDGVVTTAPLWPNLIAMPKILSAEVREVPLEPSPAGWRLDVDRLLAACDNRTRVILISSPNNPTGWVMSQDDQRRVLDFARKRGIWIVSDEVYARIVYNGPSAPSFLSLMDENDRLIVVNSFSKAWAMTGWRLGWLTAPVALGPTFEKMMEFNTSCAAGFVQRGGLAAVEQGEAFIRESVAQYRRARDLLVERLGTFPRVSLPAPHGAFYAFFGIDGVTDTVEFAKRVLAETGVGLAPGEAFGPSGRGHVRLCYAVSVSRLEEALDHLTPMLR